MTPSAYINDCVFFNYYYPPNGLLLMKRSGDLWAYWWPGDCGWRLVETMVATYLGADCWLFTQDGAEWLS